jgi:hypothetical protein
MWEGKSCRSEKYNLKPAQGPAASGAPGSCRGMGCAAGLSVGTNQRRWIGKNPEFCEIRGGTPVGSWQGWQGRLGQWLEG